jgi:hypothetical protein
MLYRLERVARAANSAPTVVVDGGVGLGRIPGCYLVNRMKSDRRAQERDGLLITLNMFGTHSSIVDSPPNPFRKPGPRGDHVCQRVVYAGVRLL